MTLCHHGAVVPRLPGGKCSEASGSSDCLYSKTRRGKSTAKLRQQSTTAVALVSTWRLVAIKLKHDMHNRRTGTDLTLCVMRRLRLLKDYMLKVDQRYCIRSMHCARVKGNNVVLVGFM